MSTRRRRQVVEVELGRRTAYLSGQGVHEALELAGAPSMRCPRTRRWCCPIDRVDDVMTVIEHVQRRRVDLIEETLL